MPCDIGTLGIAGLRLAWSALVIEPSGGLEPIPAVRPVGPMTRQGWYILVAIFAMLVPVILALAIFPTPMVDISENFAHGRFLTLTTPEHPPMQVWVSGLLARVLPPNAVTAILAGQILNLIGVLYVFATLERIVARPVALLFAFLFATSLYFMVAPLSYALNADFLQIPICAAIVFHLLRAEEGNRWVDWISLAVWSAAAVYAKYSTAIFFVALAIASLAVPEYRRLWRNPRLYIAIVVGAALITPHALALLGDSHAITYAEARVGGDLTRRLTSLGYLLGGPFFYLLPGWIILAVGFLLGDFRLIGVSASPTARFLRVACLSAIAVSALMIVTLGVTFLARYEASIFVLLVPAVASFVEPNADRWPKAERRVLWAGGLTAAVVVAAASVIYGFFTAHDYMQEPSAAAATAIRADWDQAFTCGPGYIAGDRSSAHGLSLTGDRRPIGVALTDIPAIRWFDADRLKREGAVIVSRQPIQADMVVTYLPGSQVGPEKALTLPFLRSRSGGNLTYHYAFVPPEGCVRE